MTRVTWDRDKLERFKHALKEAEDKNQGDVFTFEGNEFFIGYAKYLIEFLETNLR